VYVPIAVDDLGVVMSGRWEPSNGYAVTQRLLDIIALDDEDEVAEEVRGAAAADAVLELRSQRRAVVVVDYPRQDVTPVPGGHPAAVTLVGRVDPSTVACAFVDEDEAVVDARDAVSGDADALERLEQRDLLWYGPGEIDALSR